MTLSTKTKDIIIICYHNDDLINCWKVFAGKKDKPYALFRTMISHARTSYVLQDAAAISLE